MPNPCELMNNNRDGKINGNPKLRQEARAYYRKLVSFEEEPEHVDQKYYDTYKARADKVITLLRKATKNIYNKPSDSKASYYYGQIVRPPKDKEEKRGSKTGRSKSELKEQWKQHFDFLFTSEKLLDALVGDSGETNLDAHFNKMLTRTNTIVQTSLDRLEEEEEGKEEILKSKMHHQINRAHKGYLKTILECAKNNESKFKYMKEDLKKQLNRLGDTYDKGITALKPKTLESIRTTLDANLSAKTYEKPVRHFSRKALNALSQLE